MAQDNSKQPQIDPLLLKNRSKLTQTWTQGDPRSPKKPREQIADASAVAVAVAAVAVAGLILFRYKAYKPYKAYKALKALIRLSKPYKALIKRYLKSI